MENNTYPNNPCPTCGGITYPHKHSATVKEGGWVLEILKSHEICWEAHEELLIKAEIEVEARVRKEVGEMCDSLMNTYGESASYNAALADIKERL